LENNHHYANLKVNNKKIVIAAAAVMAVLAVLAVAVVAKEDKN